MIQEFREAIVRDKENNAIVKLNEKGYCPLLNEDRLCRVFIEAGEENMCNVCKEYPRGQYIFGDILLKYICISCPEKARILFVV